MTSHQLFLIAKFYPGRMLRQQLWRITAAQLLWLAMSARRGQTKAWIRGAARGLRRFRPMRRESDNLRSNSLPLEIALTAAESDIARIQKASGWDGYWKWYFRLTGMPPEGPA
jgi:hypothetical protein